MKKKFNVYGGGDGGDNCDDDDDDGDDGDEISEKMINMAKWTLS